jgi:hypothetical protein
MVMLDLSELIKLRMLLVHIKMNLDEWGSIGEGMWNWPPKSPTKVGGWYEMFLRLVGMGSHFVDQCYSGGCVIFYGFDYEGWEMDEFVLRLISLDSNI